MIQQLFRMFRSAALRSTVLVLSIVPAAAQLATSTAAVTPPPQALFPVSTASSNGDVNPYGVAFIPPQIPVSGTAGLTTVCNPGDILISNFNNAPNAQNPGAGNLQGLGTTITRIQSNGLHSTFFQSPATLTQMLGHPGQGFTNALVALQNGMVIVGNLPTTDGTFATVGAGSLLFIRRDGTLSNEIFYQPNPSGSVVTQTAQGYVTSSFFASSMSNAIDGPWSMAVNDQGNEAQLFISNVLNGTIVRFHLSFDSDGNGVVFDLPPVVIASGLNHQNDANLFLTGPSGLYYDPLPSSPTQDTLFFANSKDNAVYMLPGAGWNQGVMTPQLLVMDTAHLSGPLGVALAPNGNLYVANSDGNPQAGGPAIPSAIVIYNMQGQFQGEFSVDPNAGGAFGIAFQTLSSVNRSARNGSIEVTTPVARFGAVDDNQVVFNLWLLYFN
jgi:hypothetical protein